MSDEIDNTIYFLKEIVDQVKENDSDSDLYNRIDEEYPQLTNEDFYDKEK